MKEDFLHFLWKTQRFDVQGLRSVCGKTINIIAFGEHNDSDGPDFLNANLRIDGINWFGHVEMHTQSAHWYQHAHDQDPAYDNVILHVVLDDDRPVKDRHGKLIPTLEMKKRIPKGLDRNYRKLMAQQSWIPCQAQFQSIGAPTKDQLLNKVGQERAQRKVAYVENLLDQYKGDWEQAFFKCLCRHFGQGVNAAPSEALARSLPFNLLVRHRDRLVELEALLFGQAGMLSTNFTDAYPNQLKELYAAFQNKYRLHPMARVNWKFLRMRPSNFPTIRIAQIARLLHQSNHLFSKILAAKNLTECYNLFDLSISNYWRDHYVFDKSSTAKNKKLGKNAIQLLIINAIVPFLQLYAQRRGDPSYADKAKQFLRALPPERNHILSAWQRLELSATNAQESQALLELYKSYCQKKRCLDCSVGHEILEGGLKSIELRGSELKH